MCPVEPLSAFYWARYMPQVNTPPKTRADPILMIDIVESPYYGEFSIVLERPVHAFPTVNVV